MRSGGELYRRRPRVVRCRLVGDDAEDLWKYTTMSTTVTSSEDGASTGCYSASEEADSVVLPFAMTMRRVVITKY